MKFIWEEKDIKGNVAVLNRGDVDFSKVRSKSAFLSRMYVIGYMPSATDLKNNYYLISYSDGLIVKIGTKTETAHFLTDQKYIPLNQEELDIIYSMPS